ncbi:MAG: autotransporter assembly complex protein TamA [Alkalilacustris sp.]
MAAGPAVALDAVDFTVDGTDNGLEQALRASSLVLETRAAGVEDPQELLAAAKAEYARMVGVLFGAGHYGGVVSVLVDGREAADFDPLEVPRSVTRIEVIVDPGPRFTFGRAEIAPLAPGSELPAAFAEGRTAQSDRIRQATSRAVDDWRAASHALARPGAQRIVADHRTRRLDAEIEIVPGPALTFGRLQQRGTERMRENRVRRIADLPEGEPFDPAEVEAAAQRLRRTGSFSSVAIAQAETPNPDGSLDMIVTMVEAPLRRFGLGAEVDTAEGGRLSAFWLHRNLLGGAERLRVEGEVGGIGGDIGGQDFRLGVSLARPATFTRETTLTLSALAETVNERDFDVRRVFVTAGVSHRFSDRLTGDLALGYLAERTRDAFGRETREAFVLPGGLRWDTRDDERDSTRGFLVDARATPFYGIRGTDSGAQLRLDGRTYRGVGERVVLAGRVQLGSVLGARLDETPREFLFLSGGSGTVRGQPFRVLGVERVAPDGATVRIGGRGFAGLSAEARVGVTNTIGVVGFVDAGYVSASSLLEDGEWHAGAGIGLRYRTGIGPIRVDLAAPVRGDTGSGLQLAIGIGQAF